MQNEIKELKSKLPKELFEIISRKYKKLRPCQRKAISKGLLDKENLLICSPTASGKTLCGELAALKTIIGEKKKAIYAVPLKALANQKYRDFKETYGRLVKVALSTGDLDSADPFLANYDLIVCSNEKLDSLIRHKASWLDEVGFICFDEIHLIDDIERGPTLEMLITKLKELLPNIQILALSATIGNPEEIAEWLNAKLVLDEYRPVKLYEAVLLNHKAKFLEKQDLCFEKITGNETIDLALETIKENKQLLLFVSTRRFAESVAEKIASKVKVNKQESDELKELAKQILETLSSPTTQCKKLAKCVEKGIAFHHAGLVAKQRLLIEKSFQERKLKVICCTPTLALGLEFPSDRVIVRDLKRFTGFSATWLRTLEVKQFSGRCGRPSYHSYGEAFYVAKNKREEDEIIKRYIKGKPEPLTSKLSFEPVLRFHFLSTVAVNTEMNEEEIKEFFSKTLWAFQYGSVEGILRKIRKIKNQLIEWGFIKEKNSTLAITRIGLRVSQLYIDPYSAYKLLLCLEKAKNYFTNIGILQQICSCIEMKPLLKVKPSEYEEIENELARKEHLLYEKFDEFELGYEEFLASFKTALALNAWLNEVSEEKLLEKFGLTPGELQSKLQNADWLLYSLEQLSILKGITRIIKELSKLRLRLHHGVKEELLPLVKFKGIGRVRARVLYNAGIKNAKDIKKASLEKLSLLLGKTIAKKLKEQA